ncbi:MAG TPA: hypothetical protein VGG89_12800 [Candidatus Baltobacteraceae bacterium]|jgi:hypothetical protein
MMTQELNVCVLAAPLAAIDRRALSQAWYSALHRASGKPHQAPREPQSSPPASRRKRPVAAPAPRERHPGTAFIHQGQKKSAKDRERCAVAASDIDRRAHRSPLARRIERKFLDPRSATHRATFTAAGKRVHVTVQASQGRVRLVAVCAPVLREAVARALAQARFALASRGVQCF